jgi:hypothetical protein
VDNPLKDHDLRQINKALYMLNDMITAIDKAESCGIDCMEVKIRREDMLAKMMAIKSAYFPGK